MHLVKEPDWARHEEWRPLPSELTLSDFRKLAANAPDPLHSGIPDEAVRLAIRIREVENALLDLFAHGRMNGTVHTCVGQEFSAVAVAGQLAGTDWVTSNHRCHGHFIAKTGDWKGLVDELMGLTSGVCKGVGSSQHLCAKGFLSNGVQGSLAPVASGIALHQKRTRTGGITVSFIGEGTLGEGVLYEALNLASLWQLPQLFVCENNLYSQSTPQPLGVSGTIEGRAGAFGMRYFEADSWNVGALSAVSRAAIGHVRDTGAPAVLVVRTYRLNAHSKGDDDRDREEVKFFQDRDPLNRLLMSDRWNDEQRRIRDEIRQHIELVPKEVLELSAYLADQLPRTRTPGRQDIQNEKIRLVQALNRAYRELANQGAVLMGEDIHDPYGGAFKVTRGIAQSHPDNVLTTPISEAGITGVAAGLALMGERPIVEIMFGDFTTNAFDQLINNISKFHHMYAGQMCAPVRLRTPMGGKRGYGPTHSQSLEKFLVGIDNVAVIALSSLEDPAGTLREVHTLPGPTIIVESKVDYGRTLWQGSEDYRSYKEGGALGTIVLAPLRHSATLTVVAYGESAREIAESLREIFIETDEVIELLVPILLHPFDVEPVLASVAQTGRLLVVEDGSVHAGISAEVVSAVVEASPRVRCWRLGADPVPIPSVVELERAVLPGARKLVRKLHAIGGSA